MSAVIAVDEATRKYLRERDQKKAIAEGRAVSAEKTEITYARPSSHKRDFRYGNALLVKDANKVVQSEKDFLRLIDEELTETIRTGLTEAVSELPGPSVRRRTKIFEFPLVGIVGKVKDPTFRGMVRNSVIGALEDIHKVQDNGSWRLEAFETEVEESRIVVLGTYVDLRNGQDIKYQDGKAMLSEEVKKSADYMAQSIADAITRAAAPADTEEPAKRGPGRPPKT